MVEEYLIDNYLFNLKCIHGYAFFLLYDIIKKVKKNILIRLDTHWLRRSTPVVMGNNFKDVIVAD